ncbi:MAG: hypothetical protein KF754_09165 [Planctomycetes bacterium]|nr:hypothetical protein [Planctomycetota bacterium]
MRVILFCLALLVAAPLAAQEKPKVNLAVAYPATTLVYGELSVGALGDLSGLEEVLSGLGGDIELPDISRLVATTLELELTKQELRDLASGTLRVSGAIVDIAVKGPKLQFTIEHKNLAALERALAKAAREGKETVTGMDPYEGCNIYALYLPLDTGPSEGLLAEVNPVRGLLANLDLHAAIVENRFLVLAGSSSGCKDAVDGLLFPEDPAETLLGNKRFTEALKDYVKPDGHMFVNIQALINTIERLSGDKGSSPIIDMMLRGIMPAETDASFWASLTQYEQLKSFAGALWLPTGNVQARVEARLGFHNAPGWLDALRVPARPLPLLELMPEDTTFAMTSCVDDFDHLYRQCKAFFFSRAKEAGQQKVMDAWDNWEEQAKKQGVDLKDMFLQLGGGQAYVTLPATDTVPGTMQIPASMLLLGVRDVKQAENYFYEKLLPSMLGEEARKLEGDLSPVEVVGGIEIHADLGGRLAYAFIPLPGGDNKGGVFAVGEARALRRMAAMRQGGRTLAQNHSFASAQAAMWPAQNMGMYINVGAVLQIMAEAYNTFTSWNFDFDEEFEAPDRDDVEPDRNPIPRLAQFFSRAAIVGGSRSGKTDIELRFCAAGVPAVSEFGALAEHYQGVARNMEVRDDLLRVRQAAVTHLVLKGEPAADVGKLSTGGYLARPEWAIDPYGKTAEADSTRSYLLAPVPKDVDFRQAILLAYQAQPGLRGRHVCVLWNNHVVTMTPEQLQVALERASRGESLAEEMYSTALQPLFMSKVAVEEPDEWDGPGVIQKLEVAVIDDEGQESVIEVDPADATRETEKALNQPGPDKEKK